MAVLAAVFTVAVVRGASVASAVPTQLVVADDLVGREELRGRHVRFEMRPPECAFDVGDGPSGPVEVLRSDVS